MFANELGYHESVARPESAHVLFNNISSLTYTMTGLVYNGVYVHTTQAKFLLCNAVLSLLQCDTVSA